jgi:subtilisin family serine protease
VRIRASLFAVITAAAFSSAGAAEAADRYIVVLKPGASQTPGQAASAAKAAGANVRFVYRNALQGYSATLPEALLAKLRSSRDVAYVERAGTGSFVATQSGATWGLDRVDQRNLPLNSQYTYNATGAGVKAYDIDTGLRITHQEFTGRVAPGVDFYDGGAVEDCQGHGTHTAGTIAGTTWGVAKGVTIVPVRIGECSSSLQIDRAIAGIDWVTGDHQPGQPAVANMSFQLGSSQASDDAVNRMIDDGVTAAVAAGNGNALGLSVDACSITPARVPRAITVSSTDNTDTKVGYANTGTCVDLFAPGNNITSAGYTSDTASAGMSGTSMATPHVAGAAALYLQTNPGATPAQVHSAILGAATAGVVKSPGSGSPNRLLYTAGFSTGGTPTNQAPVASFTNGCTGLSCTFTDTSTDSDGTVASRSWNFGDGTTSTAANPAKTYAAAGTYTVTLTVTDNAGATNSTSRAITVTAGGSTDPDPATPTLTNGVAKSGTSGAAGGWKYFKIAVPAGKSSLAVVLDGPACGLFSCSADLDLFVKRTVKPTLTVKDCSAETGSSDETCSVANPAADYYYVGVYTYSGSAASFTIKATY